MEIDNKYHLLKKGYKILDIGCVPGSWTQYILQKIGQGLVVGIDIDENIKVYDPRFIFIKGDILNLTPQNIILNEKAENKHLSNEDNRIYQKIVEFDLIASDAAPNTTGDTFSDSQLSLEIVKKVFQISDKLLKHGGTVIAKVFQGEDVNDFIKSLKNRYEKIKQYKPRSSRKESREIYIIALNKI